MLDSGRLVGPLLLWMDLKLRGLCEHAMSQTDEFWKYAKEAIISATRAKTEDELHGLLDLARTWTQEALVVRASSAGCDSRADQLMPDLGFISSPRVADELRSLTRS
jgi:hypothetical protein